MAKDIYPIGRLDKDSEGLLILTNDNSLNAKLLSPKQKHKRTYFVQLDNELNDKAISELVKGVQIKLDRGVYITQPCTIKKLSKPPVVHDRNPPVRYRKEIPTSWAMIELTEGKNRQIRKMFASVGFPVLRLIRVQIENLKLGKLEPGKYYEISQTELYKLLNLEPDTGPVRPSRLSETGKKKNPEKKSTTSLTPGRDQNTKKTGHAPWQKKVKRK